MEPLGFVNYHEFARAAKIERVEYYPRGAFAAKLCAMRKISSSAPNKNAGKDTRNCASSAFLLLLRGVFALLMHEKPILRLKRPSPEFVCAFGRYAFFACVKFMGIR